MRPTKGRCCASQSLLLFQPTPPPLLAADGPPAAWVARTPPGWHDGAAAARLARPATAGRPWWLRNACAGLARPAGEQARPVGGRWQVVGGLAGMQCSQGVDACCDLPAAPPAPTTASRRCCRCRHPLASWGGRGLPGGHRSWGGVAAHRRPTACRRCRGVACDLGRPRRSSACLPAWLASHCTDWLPLAVSPPPCCFCF